MLNPTEGKWTASEMNKAPELGGMKSRLVKELSVVVAKFTYSAV